MIVEKRRGVQLGIVLVHDADEKVQFSVAEHFLHFAGGFIAQLNGDIGPFFIKLWEDAGKGDLSPVGGDP